MRAYRLLVLITVSDRKYRSFEDIDPDGPNNFCKKVSEIFINRFPNSRSILFNSETVGVGLTRTFGTYNYPAVLVQANIIGHYVNKDMDNSIGYSFMDLMSLCQTSQLFNGEADQEIQMVVNFNGISRPRMGTFNPGKLLPQNQEINVS